MIYDIEIFSKNLATLMQENGLSCRALAEKVNVSASTISRYSSKSCVSLRTKNVKAIADYFGITIEEMLYYEIGKAPNRELSDAMERWLIQAFRKLNEEGKREAIRYTESLKQSQK